MDAQTIITALGGLGTATAVGVAVGRQISIRKDIASLHKRFHELHDWRTATLPKEYVQKEALALILKPITDALDRMEQQQRTMALDLRAVTRWIDQHTDDETHRSHREGT